MSLPVPVVWSEDCLRHEPAWEVWLGVRDPGTEVPARALALRDALSAAGAPVVPAREHDDTVLRAVHDPALVDHLAQVWARVVGGRAARRVRPGPGRAVRVPHAGTAGRAAAAHAARGPRPGRAVLLRHDDAGRPGQLGRDPRARWMRR